MTVYFMVAVSNKNASLRDAFLLSVMDYFLDFRRSSRCFFSSAITSSMTSLFLK